MAEQEYVMTEAEKIAFEENDDHRTPAEFILDLLQMQIEEGNWDYERPMIENCKKWVKEMDEACRDYPGMGVRIEKST